MKEITREDWQKNPTPRMMWVWDGNEENREKRLVVHCLTRKDDACCFVAEDKNGRCINYWIHCAEIEEPRCMTNQELAWWLRDHPEEHRECKNKCGSIVSHDYIYSVENENEPCDDIVIRSNGGEWREPLKESEE